VAKIAPQRDAGDRAGRGAAIRYVVPAGAAIELWDSGTPVAAEPADTVQTLAARYGVPAWAIAQIKPAVGTRRPQPGQRVVVPRHLDPARLYGPDPGIEPRPAPLSGALVCIRPTS